MLPFASLALATFVRATPARVAQTSPVPTVTSTGSLVPQAGSSAPVPSPTPAPADDATVRRGPATAPRMLPPTRVDGDANARPGDVTIRNSGSTNTAGYTIVVHPDASADVTVEGTTERKTVGAPQARWLFRKVREAGALAALPGGGCMKSASFGSSTTMSFGGSTTPDLTCGGNATTRELARTANVIVNQLGIVALRGRGRLER